MNRMLASSRIAPGPEIRGQEVDLAVADVGVRSC